MTGALVLAGVSDSSSGGLKGSDFLVPDLAGTSDRACEGTEGSDFLGERSCEGTEGSDFLGERSCEGNEGSDFLGERLGIVSRVEWPDSEALRGHLVTVGEVSVHSTGRRGWQIRGWKSVT